MPPALDSPDDNNGSFNHKPPQFYTAHSPVPDEAKRDTPCIDDGESVEAVASGAEIQRAPRVPGTRFDELYQKKRLSTPLYQIRDPRLGVSPHHTHLKAPHVLARDITRGGTTVGRLMLSAIAAPDSTAGSLRTEQMQVRWTTCATL